MWHSKEWDRIHEDHFSDLTLVEEFNKSYTNIRYIFESGMSWYCGVTNVTKGV